MSNKKSCAKQDRHKSKVSEANYNKLQVKQSLREEMSRKVSSMGLILINSN